MKWRGSFIIGIGVVLTLFYSMLVFAQNGLPPLPADANNLVILLPDTAVENVFVSTQSSTCYLMLADEGDEIEITMRRTEGNLIPKLTLLDMRGNELISAFANDLAGRNVTITYTVPDFAWYCVIASHDQNASSEAEGRYTLLLSGSTNEVYSLLAISTPVPDETPLNGLTRFGDVLTLTPTATATPSFTSTYTPTYTNTPTSTRTLTPSNTPTASDTPLPSDTPTATFTPSNTRRPTNTLTPSRTLTPSNTAAPTRTFTPTHTSTRTPRPTATPTSTLTYTPLPTFTYSPTFAGKPTALPILPSPTFMGPVVVQEGLYVGGSAIVVTTEGDRLNMRISPNTGADIVERLGYGTVVTIIGGPDYSQGYTWWQLRAPSNATGWAVESADNIDTLIPSQSTSSNNQPSTCSGAPDPLFSVGDTVVMDFSFGGAMRILTHPDGGVRDAVGQAYDGHQLLLLEGPVCSESNRGWVWFVEHLPSGLTGWVLEAVSGDRYMCPLSDANCAS